MPSSSVRTSGGSVNRPAARFSRRWVSDDVPGISRMLGARCSSHASATCIGVAPRDAATSFSTDDCSGVNPPSGKNGTDIAETEVMDQPLTLELGERSLGDLQQPVATGLVGGDDPPHVDVVVLF